MKLKWKVSSVATGRYRSFDKRGWPSATYADDGELAAMITCADEYVPHRVKAGEHKVLRVHVADHSCRRGLSQEAAAQQPGFKWRRLIREYATLDEAKAAASAFLEAYPHFTPKGGS